MKRFITYGAALTMALVVTGCATTSGGSPEQARGSAGPDKVVHHINDTPAQAANALRNINT